MGANAVPKWNASKAQSPRARRSSGNLPYKAMHGLTNFCAFSRGPSKPEENGADRRPGIAISKSRKTAPCQYDDVIRRETEQRFNRHRSRQSARTTRGEDRMKGNSSKRGVARRSVLKAGLVLGAAQVAGPFVIKRARRRAGEDRARQSADRHLRGARQERVDRLPARGRADQRQGRHPRAAGPAAGRGFDQRRRRHRGAEGAQADRPRQGRFPAGQRQLGARHGDGAGEQREGHPPRGARRPHRRGDGNSCHWNVFRVCNTTQMEANAVAGA